MRGGGSRGRRALAAAGLLLALATIAGAVGAHVLSAHWAPVRMRVYDIAVRYQFYDSLGLLGIGLVLRQEGPYAADRQRQQAGRGYLRIVSAAAWLVFAGIVLFSGSLYGLTLGAPPWTGFVTPVGGVALIGGWLLFAYGLWRG
jgi:uncharacterized membrane protein YgdD (TMEM256/DUF423 family)